MTNYIVGTLLTFSIHTHDVKCNLIGDKTGALRLHFSSNTPQSLLREQVSRTNQSLLLPFKSLLILLISWWWGNVGTHFCSRLRKVDFYDRFFWAITANFLQFVDFVTKSLDHKLLHVCVGCCLPSTSQYLSEVFWSRRNINAIWLIS